MRFDYSNRPQSAGREKCKKCNNPMLGIDEFDPRKDFFQSVYNNFNFCDCPETAMSTKPFVYYFHEDDNYSEAAATNYNLSSGRAKERYKIIAYTEKSYSDALKQKLAVAVEAISFAISEAICMCYSADEPQAHRNPCIHCRNRAYLEGTLEALALINSDTKKGDTNG